VRVRQQAVELVHGVEDDEAKTEFWVVRRMGVFWEYLEIPAPAEDNR
jgi:hypothetical protein